MQSFAWRLEHFALDQRLPVNVFSDLKCPESWMWLDNAAEGSDSDWSYLACMPRCRAQIFQDRTLIDAGTPQWLPVGRLEGLRATLSLADRVECHASGPPFLGGWAGWFGYDLTNTVGPGGHSDRPLAALCYFDQMLAFQHSERRWWAVVQDTSPEDARVKIERLLAQIAPGESSSDSPPRSLTPDAFCPPRECIANFSRQDFEQRIQRVLDYIAAGDVYQVNLAQRFSADWNLGEAQLYLRLRRESPAQFGAFLPSALMGCHTGVLSISPELFLRVRAREILTRPIKGTRPCASASDSAAAARDLNASAKERAELNMIVDLERNDLGRVCEYGSVRVASAGETQTLPTLVHRVAAVHGRLRTGISPCDVLEAAFPGGSITGAPKIRAMQIISELETVPRGPYCGAIGWIGSGGGGDMELSIAIRTAVLEAGASRVDYHAGSGIVADSDPRAEYEETLHKAEAFFRAIDARPPQSKPQPRGPLLK